MQEMPLRRGDKPSITPTPKPCSLRHQQEPNQHHKTPISISITSKKTQNPKLITIMFITMMNKKRREMGIERRRVIVVLEGIKVSDDPEAGLGPLRRAVRDVIGPRDEILVLALLRRIEADHDPARCGARPCCVDEDDDDEEVRYLSVYVEDPYFSFLHREISSRRFVYRQIFKPFYESCKAKGVNFEVKIAAGYRPKDIIVEEANKANATWIVMDSCFTRDLSFRINGTSCNVSLVSDQGDEDPTVDNGSLQNVDQEEPEDSVLIEEQGSPKSPRISTDDQFYDCNNHSLTFSEPPSLNPPEKNARKFENDKTCESSKSAEFENGPKPDTFGLELPLQLSWEAILRITRWFGSRIFTSRDEKCSVFNGFLEDRDEGSLVLVKMFTDDSSDVLGAEQRAASIMNHKNISGLMGYHKNGNDTVLIFPSAERGSLATYLCGHNENPDEEWKFQDKVKIALGVAHGLRYMHEECPGGPIVHGDLVPCNVYISRDFKPMISGFGKATRIHLEPAVGIGTIRFALDPSDEEATAAIKSDILSFGVLLLRLFCRKSIPQDDRMLIDWARPFLVQRAFHELQDDDSDVHGVYKVMSAATQCTKPNPNSRPNMTEVISILKGKRLCDIQSSPCERERTRTESANNIEFCYVI